MPGCWTLSSYFYFLVGARSFVHSHFPSASNIINVSAQQLRIYCELCVAHPKAVLGTREVSGGNWGQEMEQGWGTGDQEMGQG